MIFNFAVNLFQLYYRYLGMTHSVILFSHICLRKLNEIIQTDLNKITDWFNANKLSVNATKPNLFFSDPQIRIS